MELLGQESLFRLLASILRAILAAPMTGSLFMMVLLRDLFESRLYTTPSNLSLWYGFGIFSRRPASAHRQQSPDHPVRRRYAWPSYSPARIPKSRWSMILLTELANSGPYNGQWQYQDSYNNKYVLSQPWNTFQLASMMVEWRSDGSVNRPGFELSRLQYGARCVPDPFA